MESIQQTIVRHGLCIIKDQYFVDFPNATHMDNKNESRPYYLAIKTDGDIVWMIPISSKVDKYNAKIDRYVSAGRECVTCHIASVKSEKRAFLIGNAIPVTSDYIKKPFTVNGIPYVMQNSADVREIDRKLKKYLALIRQGKMRTNVDILGIERSLLSHHLRHDKV